MSRWLAINAIPNNEKDLLIYQKDMLKIAIMKDIYFKQYT